MPQGFQWFIRLDSPEVTPAEITDGVVPVVRSRRHAVAIRAIDLEAIRADHLAELARLEAAHAGEVGALRDAIAVMSAEHADAFARLESANGNVLKAHAGELTQLEAAHADVLQVLRTSHAGELDALRRELITANASADRPWWRWLFGLPPG